MAHNKADVIHTRNELLRLIGKQRDIYAGAIANLDNTKAMLLMVHESADGEEIMDLPEPSRRSIKDLANKITGNGP